tara:strand:- start:9658 stop:9927 length:270 start_codon:yes stop_codon:yes gene_type:complete
VKSGPQKAASLTSVLQPATPSTIVVVINAVNRIFYPLLSKEPFFGFLDFGVNSLLSPTRKERANDSHYQSTKGYENVHHVVIPLRLAMA